MGSSHFTGKGKAIMVDISGKRPVKRYAEATALVRMAPKTIRMIQKQLIPKGDVLAVAKVAGIMAAKKTSEIIPLCHPIGIENISITFGLNKNAVVIHSKAICTEKTGIEMESLLASAVAAMTIYDMCKGVDSNIRIENVRLVRKTKEEAA